MHLMTDGELRALKTASHLAVKECGGLEAASSITRIGKTGLAAAYDPHALDRFMPIDAVADLERASGKPVVTARLAALSGYRLVALPAPTMNAVNAIALVFQRAGEVGAAFAHGMEDGALSHHEWSELLQDLLDLAKAATEAAAGVKGKII